MHLTDDRKLKFKSNPGRIFLLILWQQENTIPERYISFVLLIVFKVGFEWAVLLFPLCKWDTKPSQMKADFWWKWRSSSFIQLTFVAMWTLSLRWWMSSDADIHLQISVWLHLGDVAVWRKMVHEQTSYGPVWVSVIPSVPHQAICSSFKSQTVVLGWRRSRIDGRIVAPQQWWWLCISLLWSRWSWAKRWSS